MEQTAGLGKQAEVWVDGRLFVVCDGLSTREKRCPPGILENVRFTYVTDEPVAWDVAARCNPARRRNIDNVRDWSYVGFGRVLSVMPVEIDFGILTMEDPNWSTDESLVGKYVRISIDRLEIVPAIEDELDYE